jgi:hypothetical protein
MNLKASEIAAALGISRSAVSMWGGRVPATRRVELERLLFTTKGAQVEDFGVDVVWHRVPDPDWPHPAGRPCIDVAAPAVPEAADQKAAA